MEAIMSSVQMSPLFRSMGNFATDMTQLVHNVSQNGFPFTKTRIVVSAESTGLGCDGTFRYRLPMYGYMSKMLIRRTYRTYPWARTQERPIFPLAHQIETITLSASNRPIEVIYGKECLIKHVYFNDKEEAVAKLDLAINIPPGNSYTSFAKLFHRHKVQSTSPSMTVTSTTTVSAADVALRNNAAEKYIAYFEPFNPAHWGSVSTSPSQNFYGTITDWIEVPLSTTHNLKNNLDLKFLQQLEVFVKYQSIQHDRPLFQAWGTLSLNPGSESQNVPFYDQAGAEENGVPTGNLIYNYHSRAQVRSTPLVLADLSAATVTEASMINAGMYFHSAVVLFSSTTADNEGYGPPHMYGHDGIMRQIATDGDAPGVEVAADVTYTTAAGEYFPRLYLGGSDFDLDNYHYMALGPRNTDSTGDWTGDFEVASMQLDAWVRARFFLAFPWLALENSADTWHTALNHMGRIVEDAAVAAADRWTDFEFPTTITMNGGRNASTIGVPDTGNFIPDLIIEYWNPQQEVYEKITKTNYQAGEPSTVLLTSSVQEYAGEAYGTTSSVDVGKVLTLNLRSADLIYAIAIMAFCDPDEDELSGGTAYGDLGAAAAFEEVAGDIETETGAAGGDVTLLNATATGVVQSLAVGNEFGFCPNDLMKFESNSMIAHAVSRAVNYPPDLRYWAKGVREWTRTVLPTYCSFESSGVVLWSYTNNSTDDFTDFIPEAGKGNPSAENYIDMIDIHYNLLERQGMLTTPQRLPDLIKQKAKPLNRSEDFYYTNSVGAMQDYCQCVIIPFSMNPTDEESISGAISAAALNAPRINLIYPKTCRIYLYCFHYRLIQIDPNTGKITLSLSM